MPFDAIVGLSSFVVLMILIIIGIPVFLTMFLVSIVGLWLVGGFTVMSSLFSIGPFNIAQSYTFAVIPLFMVMGELAAQTGLGESIFNAANKWISKFRGGLLMATMGASAGMGAVSGSPSSAIVLSIRVALPQLIKHHYDKRFCLAGIVTAGTLTVLIPPSTPILILCILTGTSVGRALVAGIIPGIALTFFYCLTIWIYGKIYPSRVPVSDTGIRVTWSEKFSSLKGLWSVLALFIVIIGGIYLGFFTPTVGGAVGATFMLIYALARKTDKQQIFNSFKEIAMVQCSLFPLLMGGFMFARFTALTGLTDYLIAIVVNLDASPLVVMAVVVVAYILISFPMDLLPAMIITLPVFFPLLTGIGFSPFLLVVVLILLMTLANLTPPTGMSIFVAASLAKVNVSEIWRAVTPWFIVTFIFIWVLVLWPPLVTWLPDLMYK